MDEDLLSFLWNKVGPQQNRTKCPYHRIRNLFNLCSNVIHDGIVGDFVEVDVWKGGSSAVMGALCELEDEHRKTWSIDSFAGMSEPDTSVDLLDNETSAVACLKDSTMLRNFDLDDFKRTCFEIIGLRRDTVRIVKGWAVDVLPLVRQADPKISVLRIDIDWYEPTKQVLDDLYGLVTPGGYIICDDYGAWRGARKAIDEFREAHGISDELTQTGDDSGGSQPSLLVGTEHWWRKR